jgi:hypothetical protein
MSTYIRPVLSTEGRLGHLTPDQNLKLQEFWVRLYEIFDGKVDFDQTAPPSFKGQGRDADVSSLYSPAAPLSTSSSSSAAQAQDAGWFSGGFGPSAAAGFVDAVSPDTVMSNEAPRFTGKQLHRIFWKITMMDHPDLVVLKVF